MKTKDIIIVRPQSNKQVTVLKTFMNDNNINFEISKVDEYNPAFVAKVLQGKADIDKGKGISLTINELKDLCR
jgi:hypothetical protein